MSTEQNKEMACRWSEELWGQGNLAVPNEIVAPDYVRANLASFRRLERTVKEMRS